jgi:hypothetical protein
MEGSGSTFAHLLGGKEENPTENRTGHHQINSKKTSLYLTMP